MALVVLLSWLIATDHNTIAQADDGSLVERELGVLQRREFPDDFPLPCPGSSAPSARPSWPSK